MIINVSHTVFYRITVWESAHLHARSLSKNRVWKLYLGFHYKLNAPFFTINYQCTVFHQYLLSASFSPKNHHFGRFLSIFLDPFAVILHKNIGVMFVSNLCPSLSNWRHVCLHLHKYNNMHLTLSPLPVPIMLQTLLFLRDVKQTSTPMLLLCFCHTGHLFTYFE